MVTRICSGAVRIAGGRGNGRDDGLKERLQVHAGDGHVGGRRPCLRHCVKHGEIKLRLVRVQIDEKIVNLVQNFLRPRVGPVNLVDHHDRLELGFESLGQHVAGLRQRPLGRVHQQHDAVNHLEGALDLAAEVGVAGGIDDVDLAAFENDRRVLGENGDTPLPLQFIRVHHPIRHLLVGAEGAGLPQHGINESGLTVVNMGDDGDITYRLGHRVAFPSFGLA